MELESAPRSETYEVYLDIDHVNAIHENCKANLPNEAIGLLAGSHNVWRGYHYTLVEGLLTAQSKSTRVRVEFEQGALGPLVAELRRSYPNSMIVGWYHSHPGYGCFLSPTDLQTQQSYFRESFHIALVVDPLEGVFDIFKLEDQGNGYRQCSFAVYSRITR